MKKPKKYLNLIIETSDNMSGFIDELVLVNSKKDNVTPAESVLLKDLIKTVKLNIKYLFAEKKYTITILKPDAKLFARKVTLEIIFQNLITNSIKYAKANSRAKIIIDINERNVISVRQR